MPRQPALPYLVAAALLGGVHGGFSIYWGCGGDALLATLGSIVDRFDDRSPLLAVGAAKLLAALLPVGLAFDVPMRRTLRAVSWVGAMSLVIWGAINSVSAMLLLLDVLPRPEPFDRAGAMGHAFLWDPLFVAWGVALAVGLLRSRPPATGVHDPRGRFGLEGSRSCRSPRIAG